MKSLSMMAASLAVWGLSGAAQATTVVNQAITEAEVRNAQAFWHSVSPKTPLFSLRATRPAAWATS